MTELPDFLTGMNFIRTANDDKRADENDATFLCFTIDADATVYVLYDSRAGSQPPWLTSAYADKHEQAAIHTDTNMADGFEIYYAEQSAGEICMGGNGNRGAGSNYIVVVGPPGVQPPKIVIPQCSDGAAGPPAGTECVFPFTYNGNQYTECTTVDNGQPWCSTDAVFKGSWGNCKNCDAEDLAVTGAFGKRFFDGDGDFVMIKDVNGGNSDGDFDTFTIDTWLNFFNTAGNHPIYNEDGWDRGDLHCECSNGRFWL